MGVLILFCFLCVLCIEESSFVEPYECKNVEEYKREDFICGVGEFYRFFTETTGMDGAVFVNSYQNRENRTIKTESRSLKHKKVLKLNISKNAYLLLPYPKTKGFGENYQRFLECDWERGEVLLGCVDDFEDKLNDLPESPDNVDHLSFTLAAVCGTKDDLKFPLSFFRKIPAKHRLRRMEEKNIHKSTLQKDQLDFMMIGIQKCGTTNFRLALGSHPGIDLPKMNFTHLDGTGECAKHFSRSIQSETTTEFHYFNSILYETIPMDRYMGLFNFSLVTGEDTPTYILTEQALLRIRLHFPNITGIVLLRNPINRIYSHYQMKVVRNKREECTFLEYVIKNKIAKMEKGRLSSGLYAHHLFRWFQIFEKRESLIIIKSEDYFKNNLQELNRVYRHLGLEELEELQVKGLESYGRTKEKYKKMDERMRPLLEEFYRFSNDHLKANYGIKWD